MCVWKHQYYFCKKTGKCGSHSNKITLSSPRVTNTAKTEITICFIHRIQLKTVKSLKVIWCLGCLSPLSAQVIILASELQEIKSDDRSQNHHVLPAKEHNDEQHILIKSNVEVLTQCSVGPIYTKLILTKQCTVSTVWRDKKKKCIKWILNKIRTCFVLAMLAAWLQEWKCPPQGGF